MLVQNNSRMTNRRVRFDFKLRLQDIPKVPRLNKKFVNRKRHWNSWNLRSSFANVLEAMVCYLWMICWSILMVALVLVVLVVFCRLLFTFAAVFRMGIYYVYIYINPYIFIHHLWAVFFFVCLMCASKMCHRYLRLWRILRIWSKTILKSIRWPIVL